MWTAAAAAAWPLRLDAQQTDSAGAGVFRHGVASGDPQGDAVIIWTRVTPANETGASSIDVRWDTGVPPEYGGHHSHVWQMSPARIRIV